MSAMEKFTAAPWVMGTVEDKNKRESQAAIAAEKEFNVSRVVRVSAALFPLSLHLETDN